MSRLDFRHVATRLLRSQSQPTQPMDADLLARFAATRDENAFAELVARHGGLVRGTACRCLRDPHSAEDVYQATFLVLARKAGTIRWMTTVGPWLHATAVRLSRKALCRTNPAPVAVPTEMASSVVDPATAAAWGDVCRVLDEELAALPEALRGPLVLCYLQSHTRDEAAHALGCSLAMLKRRLERGRNLLRERLTRRGLTFPAAGFGLLVCDMSVGAGTVDATTRAAVAFATQGTASPGVAGLLEVSRGGFQLKAVALISVAVGLIAYGIAFATFSPMANETPDGQKNPSIAAPKTDETSRANSPSEALPFAVVARLGSVRLRTRGAVERMAFSPDGTKIASWSGDSHVNNSLIVWDTKTGRALRRVDLPGAKVDQLVWLADGRGIALVRSSYNDPIPFIWEFTDEKAETPEVKPRGGRGGGVMKVPNQVEDNEHDACYAISPDGKMLVIGRAGELESDREVQLWELKTGVKTNALKPLKGGVIHPGNCGEVYFTPDAKTLVVFTRAKFLGNDKFESEQLVTVWDLATSKEKSRFKAPRPATNGRPSVALSNTTLAIGLGNGDTSLWDVATGKERTLVTGHISKKKHQGFGTYAVAFTPDGKTLASGGGDCDTKLWDVASGKLLRRLVGHYVWVESLATAPGGKLLASAGQDGMIRLWDTATGADACPLPGHKYGVGNVAFSPDGKIVVTAGWDNTMRWWDAATGVERLSIAVHNGIMGLILSPDGKAVLVATDDGKLRTWDSETGRETTPANLPDDAKFATLSFTPNGKYLVATSGPKVTIWEWPGLKFVRTIDLPKPGKSVLANPPENSENRCQVAAVSADGKWLVTVAHRFWTRERDGLSFTYGADGVADVWEFATGKYVRRLAESKGTFRTGTFTADGRFLLIGAGGTIPDQDGGEGEAFDGELNLLDPVAGRWVRWFEVPPVAEHVSLRHVGASALSPDGRTLYVSYNTGEIIAYEVATGKSRRVFVGHQGHIGGLAISADGRQLVSGDAEGIALVWDTTLASATPPRKNPLTAADAEKLWTTAGRGDSPAAFAAMAQLTSSPDRALEILRREVKPAPSAPTDAMLDRIFVDLGSGEFATREKASKELEGYGESAVPGVRKRLEGNISAEARQRAIAFLKRAETHLSQFRAVELLEGLGTPEARKLLTELAAGAPSAPLTLDAGAALKRLSKP